MNREREREKALATIERGGIELGETEQQRERDLNGSKEYSRNRLTKDHRSIQGETKGTKIENTEESSITDHLYQHQNEHDEV